MGDKANPDERLERMMNRLADSVLALPDEAILAEVSEAGVDPDEEAERTRIVLREAMQTLENVNSHLSNLGHTVNPNGWYRGRSGYHNACVNCGSFVSFTTATGEMRGEALDAPCLASDQYAIRRQEASR
jgi:hypothetical protein